MPYGPVSRRAVSVLSTFRRQVEVLRAVRQVERFIRASKAPIRVCWDLDNTLVGSGRLIRAGRRLDEAISEAEPVPNMLEFYWAMAAILPNADHFVLSARRRSMYEPTLEWLRRFGLNPTPNSLCLVPYADAKPAMWERLAMGGRLVIVDDLSYDHESPEPSTYQHLVFAAQRTAEVYIGLDQISRIASDHVSADSIADQTLRLLEQKAVLATPGH